MLLEALFGMPIRQGVTIRIIFKTNLTHITPISAMKCKFWGQKNWFDFEKKAFYCYIQFRTKQKIILLYKDDILIFIQLKRNSDYFCTTAEKLEKHSFYIIKQEVHKNNYLSFMKIP